MKRTRSHPLDQGHPPEWASAWGEDEFGVFVEFAVRKVEQRMRWISPGTFWMGAPVKEKGRFRDEKRHQVTLSRGFWLADTQCTQALWEAVGEVENPSFFPGADRPVEAVSWEDAQKFLQRLGRRVPGLSPRLPTEAEWEYACRAGTETATYAGDLTIDGLNAPELDTIAWYSNNSDGTTHPVGEKALNPWGLADILGNVWEWCQDWRDDYPEYAVVDPLGPEEGAERVVRGGSWSNDAQGVRAASRGSVEPSYRSSDLGFRLARGQ